MQVIEDKAIEWGLTDEIVTEVAQIRALLRLSLAL